MLLKLTKPLDKDGVIPIEVEKVTLEMLAVKSKTYSVAKGKNGYGYKEIYCGFDIETTNVIDRDKNIKNAFMWIWQFSFQSFIIIGRTWEQFTDLLCKIIVANKLSKRKRLLLPIANLSFEFQFFRKHFDDIKVFAKQERQPISALLYNCIDCRDVLAISGGSLATLAKNYCTTQKRVGDLDYSILRNKSYVPTDTEYQYIYNDVIILNEYSQYLFENFIHKGFLPLTKTSILRRIMRAQMSKEDKEKILAGFPSQHDYEILMNKVFRGGFVHSSAGNTGLVLFIEKMFDFTSSYPAVMLHFDGFPYGAPIELFNVSRETLFQMLHDDKRFYFKAVFKNLQAIRGHSIESYSKTSKTKCEIVGKRIIDNGRVYFAETLETWLTDYDLRIYNMFYKWDEMHVLAVYEFPEKGKLPEYVLNPMKEFYLKKAQLKKAGMPYALEKEMVNSFYGAMVTRLYKNEITYSNKEWGTDAGSFDFYKARKNQFLLPQWGIYITGVARFNLLRCVYKCDKNRAIPNVVFCDTDSIKLKKYDNVSRETIEKWNNRMKELNKDLPPEFWDIGFLDDETKPTCAFDMGDGLSIRFKNPKIKFKTQGAKRYIFTDSSGDHVTIAGLPKKSLVEYAQKINKNVYDVFNQLVLIPLTDADKITTCYNDDTTTAVVNGEIMTELSSVALYEIPFTMRVVKEYFEFYKFIQKENRGAI